MPFIPFANTAGVQLIFNAEGQRCENTLYFDHGTSMTVEDLETLAEVLVQWWDTDMQPLICGGVELVTVIVDDLSTETSPGIEWVSGLPLVGTDDSGCQANNVALAITLLTSTRGRSFRGRNYILGVPISAKATANVVEETYAASLVSAYASLRADALVEGFEMVVASRYSLGAPRVAGVVTPVTNFRVNLVLDSQRRRLPERGT